MKNIILINYDLSRGGGSERVAVNLANGLYKHTNVTLVSIYECNPKMKKYDTAKEIDCVTLIKDKGNMVKYYAKAKEALRELCRKKHIDTIIAVGFDAALFSCGARVNDNMQIMVCAHTNLKNTMYNTWRYRLKRLIALRKADRFITLTERDMGFYKEKYPKYTAKYDFVYNWVNDELMESGVSCDIESKKLLTICRIDRVKGLEYAVEIANKLDLAHSGWVWDIYGDGDRTYMQEIKQLVEQYGLTKVFRFTGRTSDIQATYPQYSVYVSTSLFEGLPMTLLEAKAFKLPIVSFNCLTGPEEIVENGVNGFLIEPGDVDAAAEKIKCLMEDDERRRSFSESAWSNIEKFRKQNVLNKWLRLINTKKG